MPSDRLRVLVLAVASLALLVAGTFVMGWHVGHVDVPGGAGDFALGLRQMEICVAGGCVAVELGSSPQVSGLYPTIGNLVYFGSIAFGLVVAWQTNTRVLSDHASEQLARIGGLVGALLLIGALLCGYFLVEHTSASHMGITARVERGWGPSVQVLGLALGLASLYFGADRDDGTAFRRDLTPPIPEAKVVAVGPMREPRQPSAPLPRITGTLRYVVATAELTRGGIDARREDGSTLLVMWRDVVGVVARRLPPVHDGATVVDIVSTAGSTLRIVPWTRLTGDAPAASGVDGIARAVVQLVAERCPEAKLDPATRRFVDTPTELAAQLPDVETLAAHDSRLA